MKQFKNRKDFGNDRRSSGRSDTRRSDRPRRESGDGFRGRKEFFNKDSGPGRDFERKPAREFYNAVCSKCGKSCELPFRPSQGKPVYCSDCFKKSDRYEQRGEGRRSESPRSSGASDAKLDEINAKLDKIIEALDID